MKVEFKQACELEGKRFGPDMRKKPGIFTVPGYFIFLDYFVALLKDGGLKILDVSDEDFEEKNVPEKFHAVEPDPIVISIIEGIMMSKEPKEEGEDDETTSDSSVDGDSLPESDEGKTNEEQQSEEHVEGEQKLPEGETVDQKDDSEDLKEYEELHEKAKRLNKKEKERYAELKAKLKIEE